MTVGELKKFLNKFDDNSEVEISGSATYDLFCSTSELEYIVLAVDDDELTINCD